MDQVELLTAIIEASIALIGFSGLVIALGHRASGEWLPLEKLRLTTLLSGGVVLLGCAVLALTLLSAGLPQSTAWTVSSVTWAVLVVPSTAWGISRGYRMPEDRTAGLTYRVVVSAVVVALATIQVANVISLQEFWPFFLALGATLILGVTQFIRLLWFGLFQEQGAVQAAEVGSP